MNLERDDFKTILLNAMPTSEEFGGWIAADSANHDHFLHMVMRGFDAAAGNLKTDQSDNALRVVAKKSRALIEVMQRTSAEERLRRGNELLEEIAGALAELPERKRARFLSEMAFIRDRLRVVWHEAD